MNNLTEMSPTQSDLSDRSISLTLTIEGPNTVLLQSCEVIGFSFRNRVSFNTARSLDQVFVSHVSNAIECCIKTLPKGLQNLSLPDFLVEVPGLALSGVHVIVTETKGGNRNVIFHFKEFLGGINNAFLPDVGFDEPCSNHSEKLAVNVLSEVCLPILNLCKSFEELSFGLDQKSAQSISDRAREFEFHTELLKRYIFNAGTRHTEATEGFLNAEPSSEIRSLAG